MVCKHRAARTKKKSGWLASRSNHLSTSIFPFFSLPLTGLSRGNLSLFGPCAGRSLDRVTMFPLAFATPYRVHSDPINNEKPD
ncbi:hypothetical protein BO82DRAFT_352442 [Aspergillus uvarum CBS 121591]|uniref:Uncharacterized protein n=1 Tax=Aspergillus uvarum CBS 121591 TaxID=1448315 RepID=A0A319CLT9_9EURO|nr:hypothetical protein BO82DRAFT_352442 [Aspergillus uvarum CBS 121591]PYH84047.1 hypothetical protein BO82DRAFT_352442 [Aspergillus uvarum CBS 121591]